MKSHSSQYPQNPMIATGSSEFLATRVAYLRPLISLLVTATLIGASLGTPAICWKQTYRGHRSNVLFSTCYTITGKRYVFAGDAALIVFIRNGECIFPRIVI